MTINITSGSSGWGNYVLYGTKDKPRDSEKVQFLEGDIALGDRLSQSNNYEESYYKILLAFEGKPSDEVIKSAYDDFKKEFFVGFKPDEYHIDAVIHKDTDNYHIHCRVPKQNLLTDTHLQLYMDKIDRPRKQLIQDHISLKYGFEIARETNREVFKEQAHEQINKWREQHNQKPFDFSNKKGQAEAEAQINGYLSELIKSGLIEKREDISTTLQELGLKIEKENGLDIKKDFAYTTVSNETGKMRIKGEIHHDRFYEHNAKDRTAQIDNNQRIIADRGSIEERAKEVRRELNRANEKRFNKVTELFKVARARTKREHIKTLKVGKLESINTNKHIKHNHSSSSNDIDNKSDKFAEASKHHKREDDRINRRKQLSEISSKRAYLRPTKESILLQNKLKEIINAKLTREAITRAEKSRTAQRDVIQESARERSSNKEALQRAREQRDSLSKRIGEVARKLSERAREVTKNKLDKFMYKFDEAKKRFLGKTDSIDKKNSLSERFKSVDKSIEASTQENKSVSSNLEKQQELQAPVKKRSHSRSR